MSEEDLKQVFLWRNMPEVRRYMLSQHEISFDEHLSWFERVSKDQSRHLLLYEINKNPIGFINIHEIALGGVADWGFYLAPTAPKGAGQGLGQAALQYVFEVLNLHKLCGQVLLTNERSIRFHLKLGFRREGVFRQQHFDGQRYQDLTCFGLLNQEWFNKKNERRTNV